MFEELTQQAKQQYLKLLSRQKSAREVFLLLVVHQVQLRVKITARHQVWKLHKQFDGIYPELKSRGIFLAAQCCEHLNRAIITEREAAEKLREPEVNVVPQPKAGGSFATITYNTLENPVAVEHIKADAGIDIGGVLIGMHLKEVAVPLVISVKNIGKAHITSARTRPKFIGGERAHYNGDMK